MLLVLQGMDTSGKGGVIEHVAGLVNPQGLHIASFKKPTPEELAHDFLWRIRKQVPAAGMIGVFDRSHYEDVLVVRVNGLVPEQEWRARYGAIRDFEAELAAAGVTIVKCMLHISPEEQQERLLARLDDPAKRWKYNPGDVDVRGRWADYRAAYTDALQRDRHRRRALVRHPVGPQVVPELGGRRAAGRDARGAGPAVPGAVVRRGDRAARGWRPARVSRTTSRWISQKASAAASAAIGMVSTQAMTMLPATPQRTAESRFVAPTPRIDEVIVCVVEIGAAKANAVV